MGTDINRWRARKDDRRTGHRDRQEQRTIAIEKVPPRIRQRPGEEEARLAEVDDAAGLAGPGHKHWIGGEQNCEARGPREPEAPLRRQDPVGCRKFANARFAHG